MPGPGNENNKVKTSAEARSPQRATRRLVLIVAVLAEAAVLGVGAVVLLVNLIRSTVQNPATTAGLAVVAALLAGLLAVAGRGLFLGKRWPVGLLVTWQILVGAAAVQSLLVEAGALGAIAFVWSAIVLVLIFVN